MRTIDRRVFLGAAAATALAPAALARAPDWARVSGLVGGYVAAGKLAGASLALRHGRTTAQFLNFGAQALDGAAANERTIWRQFSMTKPVTGVATLALMEDGKLRLDQPVADFLPAFGAMTVLDGGTTRPARSVMRIAHLLTHTSGLGYHINAGTPLAPIYREAGLRPGDPTPAAPGESLPASLTEFADRLAKLPLQSDPGTEHVYSLSLDLLGAVIERAAGKPFDVYLRERLFDPLGMTDTGFLVAPDARSRLAMNYRVREGALEALEPPGRSTYFAPPLYPSGGGGLVSTAANYARFSAMLLDGGAAGGVRILRPGTARLAHSNLLPRGVWADDRSAFGAGMGVATRASAAKGPESPGAYWWGGAAGTIMWNDPVRRLSVVFMTQFMPSWSYPIWSELRSAVYADIGA